MITSLKQRHSKTPKKLKYFNNKYDCTDVNKQLNRMSLGSNLSSTEANINKVSDDNLSEVLDERVPYLNEEEDSDNDSSLPDAPDVPIPEDEDDFMWKSLCKRKREQTLSEKSI